MDYMENFEEAEKIDKLRSKMLKYILYKKRTEQEIRQKFCKEDENAMEDAIEYFKELNYINDFNYVQRSVQEFINLKSLSIKEITYKLCQKGVSKKIVDEYVRKQEDELVEYEMNSARKIWQRKIQSLDENAVKDFLYKKGYRQDVIQELEK